MRSRVTRSLVIVNIHPQVRTRVFPLARHEVVVRGRIVRGGHRPPPAPVPAPPVEGGVPHGVLRGRRGARRVLLAARQTVRVARLLCGVPLVARAGALVVRATVPTRAPAQLRFLCLEGVVSVVLLVCVRRGGVARGRAHGAAVVLPLALSQQLLLHRTRDVRGHVYRVIRPSSRWEQERDRGEVMRKLLVSALECLNFNIGTSESISEVSI